MEDTSETVMVATEDDRELAVCQWGRLDGEPVFWLHGTPGGRRLRHPGSGYADRGLHVITYDRPGYGLSSRRAGRIVADAATDVAAIADALRLDRFAVAGVSGGAAPALAAAALLPDRVVRCATVVATAPFDADELDFFAGMDEEDRAGWDRALRGEAAVLEEYEEIVQWLDADLPGLDLPDHWRDLLGEAFRDALRPGPGGHVDDTLSLVRSWGFSLSAVRAPTRVMAAQDDTLMAHSTWLAEHIHGAELVVVPGGHHGPRDQAEMDLLSWLGTGS